MADEKNNVTSIAEADPARAKQAKSDRNLDLIMDIPLKVTVELGRTKMLVSELLNLGKIRSFDEKIPSMNEVFINAVSAGKR